MQRPKKHTTTGSRYKVVFTDFRRRKNSRDFCGIGLVLYDKKIVYIHNRLPERTKWARVAVLNHEKAHIKIHEYDLEKSFPPGKEEIYCDLEAIVRSGKNLFNHAELSLRSYFLRGGLSWRRNKRRVVRRILKYLGLRLSKRLIYGLARA